MSWIHTVDGTPCEFGELKRGEGICFDHDRRVKEAPVEVDPSLVLHVMTVADAQSVIGRPITAEEYETLRKALENSSIGDAFYEVVSAVCEGTDEEDS